MPMKLKSITSIRSDAVVARSSRVIPTMYLFLSLLSITVIIHDL